MFFVVIGFMLAVLAHIKILELKFELQKMFQDIMHTAKLMVQDNTSVAAEEDLGVLNNSKSSNNDSANIRIVDVNNLVSFFSLKNPKQWYDAFEKHNADLLNACNLILPAYLRSWYLQKYLQSCLQLEYTAFLTHLDKWTNDQNTAQSVTSSQSNTSAATTDTMQVNVVASNDGNDDVKPHESVEEHSSTKQEVQVNDEKPIKLKKRVKSIKDQQTAVVLN